ncbi:TPA: hypothetical protein EYP75_00940 [Candidatus Bathyarchaeota archaeon]|nr:hypothetical protein [Candidatus Bathyarchaeota archaeon]
MYNLKVQNPREAQDIIMKKLKAGYGRRVEVNFLKTKLETDLADGRKLWVVDGEIKVRRWLFLKKSWRFTYFVNAEDGRILIMRGKKG